MLFLDWQGDSVMQRQLHHKMAVAQLVEKFPPTYGTQRFITVFTRASH
jgi:hypothetical protein